MKKIETLEEKKKREDRNRLVLGTILVLILVLSMVGYAFYRTGEEESEEVLKYGGLKFVRTGEGFWQTSISGNVFNFKFSPIETKNISVLISSNLKNCAGKPLYFISENDEAQREISGNLINFVLRMQEACLIGENCSENLPFKNCSEDCIILIKKSNYTKITQEEKCFYIEANENETIKASDAFLYKFLGINF